MSLWAPPTMSFYVSVTLLTNHQQIFVLTCAQPTWSLTDFFQILLPKIDSGIIRGERTRQSAWLDAVTTLLTGSQWVLVYYNTSKGVEQPATKKMAPKPRKSSLWRATNVTFSKICGWCRKKWTTLHADFWNRAPRGFGELINSN